MCVGDSITQGSPDFDRGGFRQGLLETATAAGRTIDYVGSQVNGTFVDPVHEGYGGYKIHEIEAIIGAKMLTYQPQGVILLAGTNDAYNNYVFASVAARYTTLLNTLYTYGPPDWVLCGLLPPITGTAEQARVVSFNAQLPAVIAAQVAMGRRVYLVPGPSYITAAQEDDGVHPNTEGYAILAASWYAAIVEHGLIPREGYEINGVLAASRLTATLTASHVTATLVPSQMTAILERVG